MSVMVTIMFPVVPGQRAPVPQWSQEEEEGEEEEEDMTVKGLCQFFAELLPFALLQYGNYYDSKGR